MLEYMIDGSFFMWPIWACSVITVAVVLERWTALREAEIDADELFEDLSEHLQAGDLDGSIRVVEERPGPVAGTVAVGLRKYGLLAELGKDRDAIENGVEKAMEGHVVHVVEYTDRNMPLLATMASASPLLGMLGTVVGLVEAFRDILAKPNEVSGGISVALYTTAASLIVAVPATMLFNMLNARANRFVARVASAGDELIERLQILHGEGVRPRRGMAMAAGAEADVADERELDAEADAPPSRPASRRPGTRPPQSRT